MSGFHGPHHLNHDHHHHDHHHHGHSSDGDNGPSHSYDLHRPTDRRSRRLFLTDIGRVTVGLALSAPLLAACSSTSSESDPSSQGDDLRWGRAELGFVSAYVLARGNRAAIVDTGTAGSATAIGQTLQEMGLTYDDVDHLILTHRHGDHTGSTGEVMTMATGATVYAGQPDIEGIEVDGLDADAITGLVGGEDVFGLEMIATPGHTPGHMAVIDQKSGLLVAGDAIFTEGTSVVEGPARFFDDVPQSRDSIRVLADLTVNTLLVGHGDPIEQNAGDAITELVAQLPS